MMSFKQYLISLNWRGFETYPGQGSDICIHCKNKKEHHFVEIKRFNAVTFDFTDITKDFKKNRDWSFSWLPAKEINKIMAINQ